jgi:SAM-dependent methyltransferase
MTHSLTHFDDDLKSALAHRQNILKNSNLLHWYKCLYQTQMKSIGYQPGFRILEIGSGSSVLKEFFPDVLTSDFLPMKHVDFCADAQKLGSYPEIGSGFDAIVMTNVLHHIQEPLKFFEGANRILKPGGKISMLEPYFSLFSYLLYRSTEFMHKEGIDFSIQSSQLTDYKGPLSSSNMALPQLMLLRGKFFEGVSKNFDVRSTEYFTSLSYFMTGGAKRDYGIPNSIYHPYFNLDRRLARWFPKIFASFFLSVLEKKQGL